MSDMVRRAVARIFEKQNRWPSGSPGGKGGQFAAQNGLGSGLKKPSQWFQAKGSMFGQGSTFPGGESPEWAAKQGEKPKAPPPGSKPHLKVNDKGQPVTINYPTRPSPAATWTDKDATATFVPGGAVPASLNGVKFSPWSSVPRTESEWASVAGQNPQVDQDMPFEPTTGKSVGAGVIVREPDGRVWLTRPTNGFGGYINTFPKGTVEHGLSMQASAIKEAYEETGLQVRITGVAGDYERTTSKARFYIAERVGGTPADMGWESQAIRLAPAKDMAKLLNMGVDKGILDDLEADDFFKAAKPGGAWQNQPRWPGGTPLGGQWKAFDANGIVLPPKVGSAANPGPMKKAEALYALAKAGDIKGLVDAAIIQEKAAKANEAAGKKNSQAKWTAQVAQYGSQLVADHATMKKAEATAEKLIGPMKVSDLKAAGGKPGGSNPGGLYTDDKGQKWLVKGNAKYASGDVNGKTSDDRAKNEILAAKLMQALGVGAPDMALVNLEGKHGGAGAGIGDLGVASKWVNGASSFNVKDPAHLAAARADFAVHAWLGNYDVIGMSHDNTVMLNGKAVNIDTGGALLFRAQGLPKELDKTASEFESMRMKVAGKPENATAWSVYGGMTASDLKASASKLAQIDNDTIKKLVDTHGPGDAKGKADLTDTLIARRDAILAKAGLTTVKEGPLTATEDKPAPQPPKVSEAVKATSQGIPANIAVPQFTETAKGVVVKYEALAAAAIVAHNKGDLAMLNGLAEPKPNGKQPWAKHSPNGKQMTAFHAALVADLEAKQAAAAQDVAQGKASVTGKDGTEWKADDKGVLQPAATTGAKALSGDQIGQLWATHAQGVSGKGVNIANDDLASAALSGDPAKLQAVSVPKALQPYKDALAAAMGGSAPNLPQPSTILPPPAPKTIKAIGAKEISAAWASVGDGGKVPTGKLINAVKAAAKTGDILAVQALPVTNGTKEVEFKAAILNAMGAGIVAESGTPVKDFGDAIKAAGGADAIKALPKNEKDTVALYIYHAASKGDLGAVKAAVVTSDVAEKFKASVIRSMGGTPVAAAVTPAAPVAPVAQPKAPTTAAPSFEAKKLPATNTNAPSHNAKVDAIKAAFDAGDEKALLALNFGTNTYGKKQAELANDALAALGSAHKVAAGQKANSHPAVLGSTAQPGTVAPKQAPAPAQDGQKKRTIADLDPSKLPPIPDVMNYKGAGSPYSSKQWKNEANIAALQAVQNAALTGGKEGLLALKLPLLDPNTGEPTGKMVSVPEHPSKLLVGNYAIEVESAIEDFLNPPKPLASFNIVSASSVNEAAAKFFSAPIFAKVESQPKDQQFGHWIALGKVSNPKAVAPTKTFDVSPAQKAEGKAAYNTYSSLTKKWISHVQSSGYINRAYDKGEKTYSGLDLKEVAKALYADATPLKAGTQLHRWQGMPPGMIKQLETAPEGIVFQSGGGFCTSMHPTATKHFGPHKITVIAAEGAKAIHSHGTGGYSSEEEITTLPGQRYVLTKKQKMSNGTWNIEITMLPPDPEFVA